MAYCTYYVVVVLLVLVVLYIVGRQSRGMASQPPACHAVLSLDRTLQHASKRTNWRIVLIGKLRSAELFRSLGGLSLAESDGMIGSAPPGLTELRGKNGMKRELKHGAEALGHVECGDGRGEGGGRGEEGRLALGDSPPFPALLLLLLLLLLPPSSTLLRLPPAATATATAAAVQPQRLNTHLHQLSSHFPPPPALLNPLISLLQINPSGVSLFLPFIGTPSARRFGHTNSATQHYALPSATPTLEVK